LIGLRHFACLEYASEKQIFKTNFVAGANGLAGQASPAQVGAHHPPRFITPVTLAQTMAAFFELSLLRLCPPLPNNVTGQNGQL
jgi:hypothetical protein